MRVGCVPALQSREAIRGVEEAVMEKCVGLMEKLVVGLEEWPLRWERRGSGITGRMPDRMWSWW